MDKALNSIIIVSQDGILESGMPHIINCRLLMSYMCVRVCTKIFYETSINICTIRHKTNGKISPCQYNMSEGLHEVTESEEEKGGGGVQRGVMLNVKKPTSWDKVGCPDPEDPPPCPWYTGI